MRLNRHSHLLLALLCSFLVIFSLSSLWVYCARISKINTAFPGREFSTNANEGIFKCDCDSLDVVIRRYRQEIAIPDSVKFHGNPWNPGVSIKVQNESLRSVLHRMADMTHAQVMFYTCPGVHVDTILQRKVTFSAGGAPLRMLLHEEVELINGNRVIVTSGDKMILVVVKKG